MNDFTFELEPFENDAQWGMRGLIGPYGETMVFHVKPVKEHTRGAMLRTHLVSEHLPETYVDGIGMGGRPSTVKATMQVGGVAGTLKYNSFGLRRTSRALHITYSGRLYTYSYTKGLNVELSRSGAQVAIKTGRFVRGTGHYRNGSIQGAVDEVDLAIAIVFEAVDTGPLSPGTALLSAPLRSSMNSADGGGE